MANRELAEFSSDDGKRIAAAVAAVEKMDPSLTQARTKRHIRQARLGDRRPNIARHVNVIACRVKQNGGVNGTSTTNCTWTYDIYAMDNVTRINTGSAITPKGPPRLPLTPYTAATYGVYFIDNDGSYALFLWDEAEGSGTCT